MAYFVGDALMSHAKGGCYVCLRGDSLVDTDIQIEGEGALVLCTGCIQELAEAADLTFNHARVQELSALLQAASPERVTELEQKLADAEAALADEQKVAARLQDALTQKTKAAPSK